MNTKTKHLVKGIRFITALLAFLTLPVLSGCTNTPAPEAPEEEPVDGGRTTYLTDPDAPKVIISKDITSYDASFYLATRTTGEEMGEDFHFMIFEKNGVLTAEEENHDISEPADDELLSSLQEIIDQNDLAALNGLYDVTAGLPPEFQPGGLSVTYASGETLAFTTDNDPYALWSEEVFDVFADWFSKHGNDALIPPKEVSSVTRMDLDIYDDHVYTSYSGIEVDEKDAIDGETYLLSRMIYNEETGETVSDYILFPEDYYEHITGILASYDLAHKYDFSQYDHFHNSFDLHELGYYGFGDKTPADEEPDSDTMSLELYVEYESGNRCPIVTKKESEINAMKPMIDELTAYLDPLF